jgi:transaldolase
MGLIRGVTTNPSILSHAKQVEPVLRQLLELQPGPVAVQVTATHHLEMIQQGQKLHQFSDRLFIKVPVSREGLKAIHQLSKQGIPVMGTAVLQPRQALLAAMAGARYVAAYFGHMTDPISTLTTMHQICPAKLLVASIKELDDIPRFAQMGIAAITLKETLFTALIENNPASDAFTAKFNAQWNGAFPQPDWIPR